MDFEEDFTLIEDSIIILFTLAGEHSEVALAW